MRPMSELCRRPEKLRLFLRDREREEISRKKLCRFKQSGLTGQVFSSSRQHNGLLELVEPKNGRTVFSVKDLLPETSVATLKQMDKDIRLENQKRIKSRIDEQLIRCIQLQERMPTSKRSLSPEWEKFKARHRRRLKTLRKTLRLQEKARRERSGNFVPIDLFTREAISLQQK